MHPCYLHGLMPHQEPAARLMARYTAFWLCDKPGLGKTYTTVAAMLLGRCQGFMWITTKAALRGTAEEIERRAPCIWNIKVVTKLEAIPTDVDGLVVPWHILKGRMAGDTAHLRKFLVRGKTSHLILDESHKAKNPNSQRTMHVFGVACKGKGFTSYVDRVYCLTGTPIKAHAGDLYPSLRALAPSMITDTPTWDSYVDRYCVKPRLPEEFDYNSSIRKALMIVGTNNKAFEPLAERMAPQILYRQPENVAATMPPLLWQLAPVLEENRPGRDTEEETAWSTARRELGEDKVLPAAAYAYELMDGGADRVLVFAHHKSVIEGIAKSLRHRGIEAVHIHGRTETRKAQTLIKSWQDNPATELEAMVVQMDVAGEALTLHAHGACHHAVFAELPSQPGTAYQCVKRLHRIGQPNTVIGHLLYKPGSPDERLAQLMAQRLVTDYTFEKKAGGTINLEGVSLMEALKGRSARQRERIKAEDAFTTWS